MPPQKHRIDNHTGKRTPANSHHTTATFAKPLDVIIVKQLYDEHKEVGDFENKSLHIIIDEAHNILSSASERESETWKDYRLETFEELLKKAENSVLF